MKFVHAADIHLDSPLRGLERYEGAPVDELRSATRRALGNLVDYCLEVQADFLLICGDVYDGDWRHYSTGLYFARQMSRLREAQIPVFVIRGNHDAVSQITRELKLPSNVFEFPSKKPETKVIEDLGVAIHGQSFGRQAEVDDLSARYPARVRDMFNIGMLHTSADGREGHERYAPCNASSLAAKGYNYWALGHVHQRETLQGETHIVFPGNIQGRHCRETGSKGCTLVTWKDSGEVVLDHKPLDVARWAECRIDISGALTMDNVLEAVGKKLQAELTAAETRMLAVRLKCMGACPAHKELSSKHEQFVSECRVIANDLGGGQIWIERTDVQSSNAANLHELRQRQDPFGELLRYIQTIPHQEEEWKTLVEGLKPLHLKLPAELRQGVDPIDLESPEFIQAALLDVEQILIPRLLEREGKL